MAYSLDLRCRVVNYVGKGGKKSDASRLFSISLWCVNDWCNRKVLEAQRPKGRPRKLDWEALKSDIEKHPDKLLRERAKEFGVWPNSIWYACRCLGVTHKKNFPVQGKRL